MMGTTPRPADPGLSFFVMSPDAVFMTLLPDIEPPPPGAMRLRRWRRLAPGRRAR